MLRSLVLVPFVCSWSALSLAAQTGRTMKLMAPVVLGQTASMVMEHSPTLAGRQFAMAMCSPSYQPVEEAAFGDALKCSRTPSN